MLRQQFLLMSLGIVCAGVVSTARADSLPNELSNLGFAVIDDGVGVSGFISDYHSTDQQNLLALPTLGPTRIDYPDIGMVPSPGDQNARVFDEGAIAYKIVGNDLIVVLAAGINPNDWVNMPDFNDRDFGIGDLFVTIDTGSSISHYVLLNSVNNGDPIVGHNQSGVSYFQPALDLRYGGSATASVGELVAISTESHVLRTGLNNSYRRGNNSPVGLDERFLAKGGTGLDVGSVSFSMVNADQPLGDATPMDWFVSEWTVPLSALSTGGPVTAAFHATTSCGNDQINAEANLPASCTTCDSCTTTNNGDFEIQLISHVYDGVNTTFTYRVCEIPPNQDLSHWVLGLPASCASRWVDPMNPNISLGTDPTTGMFGIKFETASGVADCSGGCGSAGNTFTATFTGQMGASCIIVGTKAAQETSFACVEGPSCLDDCIEQVALDLGSQGGSQEVASFRPTTTTGAMAGFVLTARSIVNASAPMDPDASGSTGVVVFSVDGAGVRPSPGSGSLGISGGGAHKDEELIFTLDAPVEASTILLGVNKINFGSGSGDKDDPVLFLSSDGSSGYDFVVGESALQSAFISTGTERGLIDFGQLSSLPSGLLVDAFKLRETNDHVWVYLAIVGLNCDDGLFCNGAETCQDGECVDGSDPCIDLAHCDEVNDVCLECISDAECDDGNPCTQDLCVANVCTFPDEPDGTACPDGLFCNGDETCTGGTCGDNADPCIDLAHCDEVNDV